MKSVIEPNIGKIYRGKKIKSKTKKNKIWKKSLLQNFKYYKFSWLLIQEQKIHRAWSGGKSPLNMID